MINQLLPKGRLEITDDVISLIIIMCVKKIDGIEIITQLKDDLRSIFSKNYHRGIFLESAENIIELIIKVEVTHQINMLEACFKLQELIAKEISSMTGISVKNIVIKVEKIRF